MSRRGVVRCFLAAILFGTSAPAASRLADDVGALALAGLLYLGAALAVLPPTARRQPPRAALVAEWKPVLAAVVAGGAVGPALLVWSPGASVDVGALLIVGACACWGLDNCVTARIEQLAPEHVVFLKGIVAGGANLILGLTVAGAVADWGWEALLAALVIGVAGYGLSITLWVKGARDLGAARGQVIFAAAPFIGAALSWLAFGESISIVQVIAVCVAIAGVAISLETAHEHEHRHDPLSHDHEHTHDDGHHDHVHPNGFTGRHSHPHDHPDIVHTHPHVPDLHHRHDHD